MGKIVSFLHFAAKKQRITEGPRPFKCFRNGSVKVLLKTGCYGPPVEEKELWQWLNDNIDRIHKRVSMAVSVVEIRRREKNRK
jgi:hypothetical protein